MWRWTNGLYLKCWEVYDNSTLSSNKYLPDNFMKKKRDFWF